MARLKKEEHTGILKALCEQAQAGPELLAKVALLMSDFDEGLTGPGTELEAKLADLETQLAAVTAERDNVNKLYRERFFQTPAEGGAVAEGIVNNTQAGAPKTFEEIFGIVPGTTPIGGQENA